MKNLLHSIEIIFVNCINWRNICGKLNYLFTFIRYRSIIQENQ